MFLECIYFPIKVFVEVWQFYSRNGVRLGRREIGKIFSLCRAVAMSAFMYRFLAEKYAPIRS